jgi:T5orf172 domain
MSAPSVAVDGELREALAGNVGNLGRVYLLLQEGKTGNAEIIEAGGAANSGAASNLKTIINAILTGECPASPSLAGQAGRAIGGLLRTNSDLSAETQRYLTALRSDLDAHSQDAEAVEREDRQIEVATENLERAIEDLDGVYVYTFPTYFRTVQKIDPERILLKIGKTDRFSSVRIREQQRATNMPEDPWTLRVYCSSSMKPDELEARFHMILDAAGHGRAAGRRSGREWFYTNLEFLDAVASLLGLEVHKPEDLA